MYGLFASTARATVFYDFGQVAYAGGHVLFTDKGGFPVDYAFTPKNFVTSTGVAVQWLAPLGLFNMGSTVLLLLPPGRARWDSQLGCGAAVAVGQGLGSMLGPAG